MLAGDAPFSPVLQLESDSGLTVEASGEVSEWQDLSGSANHVLGEGDERPVTGAVQTPTGEEAITFDGVNDRLLRSLNDGPITALPDGNEDRTTFLVARFYDATTTAGVSYGRFGNYRAYGLGVSGPEEGEGFLTQSTWGIGNHVVSGETGYDAGGSSGWVILSATHADDGSNSADNAFLYQDGVEVAAASQQLNTKLNVSSQFNGNAKSRIVLGEDTRELGSVQMDVAAWLVYDGALSDLDRQQVEAYLTTKYLGSNNLAPFADDDQAGLANGASTTIGVLANDSDADGSIDPTTVAIVTPPTQASSWSVDPVTGEIAYTHNGGGQNDSFTYTVRDDSGAISNTATVTITLVGQSDPPIAIEDRVRLDDGATVDIDVLVNDADLDGPLDTTSVQIVTPPTRAAAYSVNPSTGVVSYTHDGSGLPDSFTYTVRDALGAISNETTVHIAVNSQALSLAGFTDEAVFASADGIALPISIDFLPDGRMLILEKGGVIWIADPNTQTKSVYLTLTNIDDSGEKGLLDIAVAPDFDPDAPGEDYIYLYYTPASPRRAFISRFTHQENAGGLTSTLDVASEFEVWRDTDGYIACCHYGGGLDFGPDENLWLTVSDKFTAPNAGEGGTNENHPQDLTKAGGKLIRVRPDGTVPDGTDGWPANPYIDPVDDDPDLPGNQDYHDYIWAYGLRNPFRASWDLETGRFFMAEVGGNVQSFSHEDLHIATLDQPGVNYGWPNHEGPGLLAYGDPELHSTPIYSLAHDGAGASITGGEVYRESQFPAEWNGVYFFGDYTRDTIRYLTFDDAGNVTGDFDFKPTTEIPGGADQIVSITVGPDGALYYALIGGRIRRITHANSNAAPTIDAINADPQSGGGPLEVNFSASVSDPEGDALTYTWRFGDGQTAQGSVVGGQANATHTYSDEGLYIAFLEVTDGQTLVTSSTFEISVGAVNAAPIVQSFTADPVAGALPLDVTFEATVSDPNGDTMTYEILFGDGQTSGVLPVPASGEIALTRSYTENGSFNARLRISDGVATIDSSPVNIVAGETQLPPVTDGLVVLLESDIKLSVSEGQTVAAWLDGSGNGNNLDAFGDPQVEFNSTPGGLPAIVFDGDGDKLERLQTAELNNLPGGSADRTVFTVINYVDSQGVTAGFVYGRDRTNRAFGLTTDADGDLTVQGYGLANDAISNVAGDGAGWLTQSVIVSGSSVTHYQDGGLIDSFTQTYNTILSQSDSKIVIGEEIGGLGYSQLEIGAVLMYDRALSDSERLEVEQYLNAKYFLGGSTPIANDDDALVAQGAAVSIDLLANDLDPDGILNPATLTIIDQPTAGVVIVDPLTGVATYTHAGGAETADTFTYRVDDEVALTSNLATVSITVLGDLVSGQNETVVRWHGDYYQHLWDSTYAGGSAPEVRENRWLRGGPVQGNQLSEQGLDLDNDGQFDDSHVYFDFSLTEELNPPTTTTKTDGIVYHGDLPSATFYGGLSARFYNYETDRVQQAFIENDGAGGDLAYVGYEPSPYLDAEYQGLQDYVDLVQNDDGRYRKTHVGPHEDFAINIYRPDLPHPLDESDDPSDNLVAFDAAFVWKKEDFLQGGDSQRVSLDGESFLSFESTRWWDSVGVARFLLQDDSGALYMSEWSAAGQQDNWGHTVRLDDPLATRWALYTPSGGDLFFDADNAVWIDPVSAGLFDDVQAMGVYIAQPDATGDLTKFSLDEITFNAVVGETTTPGVPVTDGLVLDLNASEGVVTDNEGDVVGWLDSSGNGNDLQTAVGEGELIASATPGGENAIRLEAGESLSRDGATDPLNGFATGSADRTLFFVVSYTGVVGESGFGYGGSGADEGFGLGVEATDGSQALLLGADAIDTTASGVGTGWIVQSVVLSGSTYRLYSDGVLIDSGVASLSTTDDDLLIGGAFDGVGGANLDVASALAFDRALSEMERYEMQAYLHRRYID